MLPDLRQIFPPPRRARLSGETLRLPEVPTFAYAGREPDPPTERRLREAFHGLGRRLERTAERAAATLVLRRDTAGGAGPQSYRLVVAGGGVTIESADAAGLFYGAVTLAQWLALHAGERPAPALLHGLEIDDAPDLRQRGVLLDISRDKVPTQETLRGLVRRLADWKINQLQLYTEHTFAYRGHEEVWRDASPITPPEASELDALCREHHIALVPNQNSFGHLHRWLVHPRYRDLAECPDGLVHPWSDQREPFSLCALDPRALDLLRDLYDQLLPCFGSPLFHAGLDETFDLGRCRSAAACRERGRHRVYLDFLLAVRRLAAERGRRLMFWADVLLEAPELVAELPQDLVPCAWGYEADHPFRAAAEPLAAAGLDVYLCPGTSSWLSLAGRAANALDNIAAAARAGAATGAAGLLTTDWGDGGHLQPWTSSALGLLAGAGLAWCTRAATTPRDLPWAELLDRHAFAADPRRLGGAALALGNAYAGLGARPRNRSPLYELLVRPASSLERPALRGLSARGLEDALATIEDAAAACGGVPPTTSDGRLIGDELVWVARLLSLACRIGLERLAVGGSLHAVDAATRGAFAGELDAAIEEQRRLWLARNRPGGLADSVRHLERARDDLLAGSSPPAPPVPG